MKSKVSKNRTPESQRKEFIENSVDSIEKFSVDTIADNGLENYFENHFDEFYLDWLTNDKSKAYFDLLNLEGQDETLIDDLVKAVTHRFTE